MAVHSILFHSLEYTTRESTKQKSICYSWLPQIGKKGKGWGGGGDWHAKS